MARDPRAARAMISHTARITARHNNVPQTVRAYNRARKDLGASASGDFGEGLAHDATRCLELARARFA